MQLAGRQYELWNIRAYGEMCHFTILCGISAVITVIRWNCSEDVPPGGIVVGGLSLRFPQGLNDPPQGVRPGVEQYLT